MEDKKYFKVLYLVCLILVTAIACQNCPPPVTTGDPVVISNIQMFTQTKGWGIGGEQEPLNHILRTSDGGYTWTDITPPEPDTVIDDPEKEAMAFFLDTDYAWVTYTPKDKFDVPTDPIIWYTTDSGASWTAGPPVGAAGGPYYLPLFLYFVDENTGWFVVEMDAAMGNRYTSVHKTEDGGVTWDLIIHPSNNIYLHEIGKTDLVFIDTQTGLLTMEQGNYATAYVQWTHDGGLTWEKQFLPQPPDPGYCVGRSPHLFTPLVAIFSLNCGDLPNDLTRPYVYKTTNGGTDWDIFDYPGDELILLDADEGFALSREIHKTIDGGQTWTHIKTVCWDGQFSFINSDIAWAVGRCDNSIALYHTINGAKSWNEILPMIP